jgi:hypothetical protein
MVAYVLGGLTFTVLFGLLVVYAFHGIHLHAGSDRTRGIADLIGGAVVLAFGIAVYTGHVHGRRPREAPEDESRIKAMLSTRVTTRTAALVGPATHIPGLFYLVALNVIVAHSPRLPRGMLAVFTYNAVWFALPILALVLCILNPAAARSVVGSVAGWAREHSTGLLLSVSMIVGIALIVRGALTL